MLLLSPNPPLYFSLALGWLGLLVSGGSLKSKEY
jgi:hypothetical protein